MHVRPRAAMIAVGVMTCASARVVSCAQRGSRSTTFMPPCAHRRDDDSCDGSSIHTHNFVILSYLNLNRPARYPYRKSLIGTVRYKFTKNRYSYVRNLQASYASLKEFQVKFIDDIKHCVCRACRVRSEKTERGTWNERIHADGRPRQGWAL